MPCSSSQGMDYGEIKASNAAEKAKEAMDEVNRVTDILCRVLRSLPPEIVASMDEDVKRWLAEHQAHDARQGR